MKNPEIWPVIHVMADHHDIAHNNAKLAHDSGCTGVFFISMDQRDSPLCRLALETKRRFPNWKVGVNHLQSSGLESLKENLRHKDIDATWTDYSDITSEGAGEEAGAIANMLELNRNHLFFGSVAFKYQKEEQNPGRAAALAHDHRMIPTTSGPATGQPAPIEKLQSIRKDIGEKTLAIASGITPENIAEQAPFLSHVLVATGIGADFYTFCPNKLSRLMEVVRKLA